MSTATLLSVTPPLPTQDFDQLVIHLAVLRRSRVLLAAQIVRQRAADKRALQRRIDQQIVAVRLASPHNRVPTMAYCFAEPSAALRTLKAERAQLDYLIALTERSIKQQKL